MLVDSLGSQHMLQHLLPQPGDTATVLLEKQLQLLLCLQVYEAWESRATDQLTVAPLDSVQLPLAPTWQDGSSDVQALPPSCGQQQQQQPPHQQQLRAPPLPQLRQLLGTDSTEDQAAAGMQQQGGGGSEGQPAHEPILQQAGHMAMPPPAPAAAAAQQQHPTSNKDLLARLLMPGQGGQAACAAAAAAAGMQPRWQQPQKAGQGRQRKLQQGRRSLLGAQGSSLPAGHQANPEGYQAPCEDSPGPLQQQMLLHMRAQHYLLDAQSQAPGAAVATADAAAGAGPASLQWPAAPAQQQLFSPRTATHAPLQAAGSSGGSGMHGSTGQACMGMHPDQETMPGQRPAHQQQQQAVALQPEQSEEIEVTPAQPRAAKPAAGAAHQQQWGSGAAAATGAAALAAAAAAAASGLYPDCMHSEAPRPTVAATPDASLDPQAALAAASVPTSVAAAAADTPMTAHTELVAAAGSRRAAAAAAAGLAAALFHTPAAAGHGNSRVVSEEPTTSAKALHEVQGASGVPEALAGVESLPESSLLGPTPPSTAQHVSASAGHTPAEGPTAAAAAFAAAAAAACAHGGLPPPSALLQVAAAAGAVPAAAAATAVASAGPGCLAGSPLLDETQPPSQPQQQQQQLEQSEPEGLQEAARLAGLPNHVAATPASEACSDGGASSSKKHTLHHGLVQDAHPSAAAGSPSHAAHQHQAHKRQRLSGLNPNCRPSSILAADPAGGKPKGAYPGVVVEMCTAGAGSSSEGSRTFVLNQQQHRVRELVLGQPVQHILCCKEYAAVLLQEGAAGSQAHRVMLLSTSRQQQQQQQQPLPGGQLEQLQQSSASVVVTATHLPVLVGPSQHPAAATTPAARAALGQQQHSNAQQELLRTGLLLLPPPAPEASAAKAGQQQGPLLAVASGLQLQGAAAGAGSTGLAAAGQRSNTKQTPAQAATGAAASKRKLPKAAADAPQGVSSDVSPQAGALKGCSQHAVNIYQLNCNAAGAAAGTQDCTGAVLVQTLPTAFAVRCLAACQQEGLLAAAGEGGSACVWHLRQQHQAGDAVGAGTDGPAAAAGDHSRQPVADAAAAVVLPAARYMGIPFPEIAEVCIVVQGTSWRDGMSEQQGQHTELQPPAAAAAPSCSATGLSGARRVLLVGCCSQGPVAVWDVCLRQQIMAVHSPGLRLSGLLAPAPGVAAVAAAAAAMRAPQAVAGGGAVAGAARGVQQHLQGSTGEQQLVVCLAVVSSLDSSGRYAAVTRRPDQQQDRQLRAVVLVGDGDAQIGRPLVAAGAGGVRAAMLSGTTAAAVVSCGVMQAWDVLSGTRHMSMRPRHSSAGMGAVALLPLGAAVAAGGGEQAAHPTSKGGGDTLLLAGSAAGALCVAML